MERKSGVYWFLSDDSMRAGGNSRFSPVILGFAPKGPVGKPVTLTGPRMQELIGYDLDRYPEMLGVARVLSQVTRLSFLRLNVNPNVDNVFVEEGSGVFGSQPSVLDVGNMEGIPGLSFWAAHNVPGNWGINAARDLTPGGMIPNPDFEPEFIPNPNFDANVPETVLDPGVPEEIEDPGNPGNMIPNPEFPSYIENPDWEPPVIPNPDWSDDETVNPPMIPDPNSGQHYDGQFPAMFSGFGFSLHPVEPSAPFAIAGNGNHIPDLEVRYWARELDEYGEPIHTVLFTSLISFAELNANYWGGVTLPEMSLWFNDGFNPEDVPGHPVFGGQIVWLAGGSNGIDNTAEGGQFLGEHMDQALIALDKSNANVVCLNGLTDISVVNAALRYCHNNLKVCFFDFPDFDTFEATAAWRSSVFASEYAFGTAVVDEEMTSAGPVKIWPSLNTLLIYVGMFNATGSLNHPPAGYRFGGIGVTALRETDFYLWGDELKTEQINYFKIGQRGPVLWEMNNMYALRSDLRKIHTVFTLLDLREQILDFLANFTFRVMLPLDLLNLDSGLRSILNTFVQRGFLFGYVLNVPSFAEAQAAGTVLSIPLRVAVNQAAEEIEMRVSLRNATNLNS